MASFFASINFDTVEYRWQMTVVILALYSFITLVPRIFNCSEIQNAILIPDEVPKVLIY